MTAVAKPAGWISPEEYLESERYSEIRREYVDGYVYPMDRTSTAGVSADHIRICRNLLTFLDSAFRGKRSEAFGTGMRVKIPPQFAEIFYYPDVTVSCDPTDNATFFRERPSVIFEVLSPDTERTDRKEKAITYRQIPSVEVYVIVEQERPSVTVLRQAETGWKTEAVQGLNGILRLPTIGVEMPLAEIYRQTAIAASKPT
jgi:Uma2 family endonuclease